MGTGWEVLQGQPALVQAVQRGECRGSGFRCGPVPPGFRLVMK